MSGWNEAIQKMQTWASMKGCPFCGARGKVISCMGDWAPGGYEPGGRRVVCSSDNCYAAGKPFYGDGMEAQAIEWWNRRTPSPTPEG